MQNHQSSYSVGALEGARTRKPGISVLIRDLLKSLPEAFLRPNRKVGWLGPIPYIAALQWLMTLAIPIRFVIEPNGGYPLDRILAFSIAILALTLVATLLTFREGRGETISRFHYAIPIFEVVLISEIYVLTKNIRSDVYLLYFVPFLYAAEYFRGLGALGILCVTSATFGSVLYRMTTDNPAASIVVFVTREVFFFVILGLGAALTSIGRREREHNVNSLLQFKEDVDQLSDLRQIFIRAAESAARLFGVDDSKEVSIVLFDNGRQHVPHSTDVPSDLLELINRRCVQSGKSLVEPALRSDGYSITSTKYGGLRSLIAAPIKAQSLNDTQWIVVATANRGALNADSLSILEHLAQLAASAIDRAHALTAFSNLIFRTGTAPLERDRLLSSVLDTLESWGFDTIGISLVDPNRNVVEMVRGRNVSFGWMRRSKHPLNSPDIISSIARSGVPEVIDGPDDRFNPDIYERFGHERLVRVFMPVKTYIGTVAVIQAGCDRSRRDKVFTARNLRCVELLAHENAELIGRIRPFIVFEEIAREAFRLIAADAASIHVYHDNEIILQASSGQGTDKMRLHFARTTLVPGKDFPAIEKVLPISHAHAVEDRHPVLYEYGVRSLIEVRLILTHRFEGMLYVYFREKEHRFTEREIGLEQAFGRLMETAIQNGLLVDAAADLAHRSAEMARFLKMIESLAASVEPVKMLGDLAQHLLFILDADTVNLYEFIEKELLFKTPPVMRGSFRDLPVMQKPVQATDILWKLVTIGESRFVESVAKDDLLSASRFAQREGIQSCAILVLKAPETDEVVGILFVNYRDPHVFREDEKQAIRALAASAAIAIRAARFRNQTIRELSQARKEVEASRTIGAIAGSGKRIPALRDLLLVILEQALVITDSPFGVVFWRNTGPALEAVVAMGLPDKIPLSEWIFFQGGVVHAAHEREPQPTPDATLLLWASVCDEALGKSRCELQVPITDDHELLGLIDIQHPTAGALTSEHRLRVQTLVTQAVVVARQIELHQEVERHVVPLRALQTVSGRVQERRNDFDCIMRLVLTGVTARQGLGFSRAFILLADESSKGLIGQVAIGALTNEEAVSTWAEIGKLEAAIEKHKADVLEELLSRAERLSADIRLGERTDSPLGLSIKKICLRISVLSGGIGVAFKKGQLKKINHGEPDPAREVLQEVCPELTLTADMVCVPINGSGGRIGVLIADMEFSNKGRPNTLIDERYLEAFCEILGLGLERAKRESEPTADPQQIKWIETIENAYHELGGSIHAVDGHLEALRIKMSHSSEPPVRFAKSIEVIRARIKESEAALDDIRNFSSPVAYDFVPCDVIELIREAKSDAMVAFRCDIQLDDLPREPIVLNVDRRRMKAALFELIRNSYDAMDPELVTITFRVGREVSSDPPLLRIDVKDNGPGVPDDLRSKVFQRGFSTKGKARGLGLARIRDILQIHGGSIKEIGSPYGAHFVMYIPLPPSVDTTGA